MESFTEDMFYQSYADNQQDSVIGHITVYEYGRSFSPVFHKRTTNRSRNERSTLGSEFIDRPKLISKIHHLLHIHRSQRKRNAELNSKCSSNIHRALQKVIRLCFEQNIGESRLYPVGDLFLELFQCTGNSMSIFSILTQGMSVSSHINNRDVNILYPPNASKAENDLAFEYYLRHLCCSDSNKVTEIAFRDVLNQEIEPFSCLTPLSAAAQKRDPILILALLRHGADPFLTLGDPIFEEKVRDPTEQLVDDLNGLYLFKNTGFNEETKSKLVAEEAKVLTCLTYISRSVINIPLTSSNHIVTSIEEDSEGETSDVFEFSNKAYNLHPEILENLSETHWKGPASLQHLCRCSVRTTLRSSSRRNMLSIPKCISSLPLPNQIQNYLDLQLD